jgi:hypothetical protein
MKSISSAIMKRLHIAPPRPRLFGAVTTPATLLTALLTLAAAGAWAQSTMPARDDRAGPVPSRMEGGTAPSPKPASDERAALEQLRATTMGLIEALVGQGLLTRERADQLLKLAPRPVPAAAATPNWGSALAAAPAASGVIRVPYLPETLKAQIRDDIRNDVLTLAREERWADPRAIPAWLHGVSIQGDLRVRLQDERFADSNLAAEVWRGQTASPAWAPDLSNTLTERERLTLRARLGVDAKVSDDVGVGLRLSTGTTSGPTSSSQTLGTGFNKAGVVIDRASLRYEPRYDFRVFAGRFANPFFGSDLLWPDDLSFDGVALQTERNLGSGSFAFATAGVFPLEELAVDRRDKWLYALQIGIDQSFGASTQLRLGAAVYDFAHIEGVRESDPPPSGPRAGTVPYLGSQYPASVRQKGNTLINLNDPTSTAAPVWGLASKFRPVNLSAALTLRAFDPIEVGLNLDWVHNSAFDIADIRRRAGTSAVDNLSARTTGVQAKVTLGMASLANKGDWQLSAALRQFERDAWVDGFTDTTWHLGGTSYKGWQVGGHYAFDRRSSLGFRLTSTRNLDDGYRYLAVPGDPNSVSANLSSAPLKIDVFQIDLNTRF